MIFTNSKITNRLMIATAIALGSTISYARAASSTKLSYGSYGLTEEKLRSWNISGRIISAETDITLTSQIQSSNCNINELYDPPNRNLLQSSNSRFPSNPQNCDSILATSSATDSVNLNQPTNKFSGTLLIKGFVDKSPRKTATVKASSLAKINITSRALKHTGTVDTAPIYDFRQLPETQSTAQSTSTTVTATVKDINTGAVLARQNLFQTTTDLKLSAVPGGFSWDNDSIDFVGVQEGTFSITFGSWTNKPGTLFLQFLNGRVSRAEDSGYFNNWLPAVGTPGTFTLNLNPPRIPNFDFNYSYNIPSFGRETDLMFTATLNGAVVPEPVTIVGTLTALGLGTYFKKKYNKRSRN